jgi:hypothetical protein
MMHLGMGGSEVKAMLFCASASWGQVRRCGRAETLLLSRYLRVRDGDQNLLAAIRLDLLRTCKSGSGECE